ncbi:GGDEF domain-containing protein [Comamonas flocculans]|uniref:diguanylate cyclase n=1 Tax=Comamonas flocculans TaxID=2597701 RepID=A0A5B8S023_9BURK|nr:GGDEF domain-containing protein [Comamonas flocculans]QEA14498.1 GGDEF domain-containing protein [Comamonas flocculans]
MASLAPLDTRTMMVMVIAGTLSMALAMAFVRTPRREGTGFWAWALLTHAGTYLLFMLRGQISDWLSIVLANTILAGTFALLLAAVTAFHGRAQPWMWLLAPIPATALLNGLFLQDLRLRLLTSSFMLSIQIVLIVWALWRPTRPNQPRGAILITLALSTQGAILLLRGIWYLSQPTAVQGLGGNGTAQSITFLSAFIVVLLASLGFVLMTRDRAEAINHELANNDLLTGIANRRLLQQTLQRDAQHAMRQREAYAVLMVDIDHFKAINDSRGHLAGDAVLRHVAQLLHSRLRSQDMVGRWGGEEFLLLLPATDVSGASRLAQELRTLVQDTPCRYEGMLIPAQISIGVCAATLQPGDRARWLVDAADKALYRAKERGRNSVEQAPLLRPGKPVPAQG